MKQFQLHSGVGKLGESLAEKYLISQGHHILAENYYFDKGKRSGEIDIITEHLGALRFIEVKTKQIAASLKKSQRLYSPPEAGVTRSKVLKCSKTAQHFLRTTRRQDQEHHFDVVSVLYDPEGKRAEIRYLRDIFY